MMLMDELPQIEVGMIECEPGLIETLDQADDIVTSAYCGEDADWAEEMLGDIFTELYNVGFNDCATGDFVTPPTIPELLYAFDY